jgi:tetratricopeptide (TPR) repeat protein
MLKGFVCLLLAALFMLGAPGPDETVPELRIEIMSIGAGVSPKYWASLERIQDRCRIGTADLAPDGVLRFRDVPYGEYRLTIIGADGTPVYEHGIAVSSSTSTVMLNLPVRMTSPSVSGTVSVSQLRQPIQKSALRSFRASQKLFERGAYEQAVHELENAITRSPGYADAYSSLAAMHIKMRLYGQALNEIAKAMSIAGPNARDLSNLALAYYNLERYGDSVEAARWALRLEPNYDPAHYVLGATLAMDRRTMPESVPHLERAARTITSAKAVLMIVQKALSRD